MADLTDADVARYREEFPVVLRWVYLNHAGVCAPSLRVQKACNAWLANVTVNGLQDEDGWEARADSARSRFARLVGCKPREVAFVRNTSHGLGLVAEGLDWKPGDRVAVALDEEYPSNVYPWRHLASRDVHVCPIEAAGGSVTPEAVERVLKAARPRLVAVSSAQYASGAVTDVEGIGALCREHGALLCVDGIQTLGALPLDVKHANVHFLAADSHKWLLGLSGIGALFVDESVIDRVRPVLVGWKSTTGAWDFDRAHFDLLPDAGKLEEGSPAYAMIYGFDAALELLLEVGIEAVAHRIRGLAGHLARSLEALDCQVGPTPDHRAHILTFTPAHGETADLARHLQTQGVVVSLRRGRIRVSPHFINTIDEMDLVAGHVSRWLASR